MNILIDLGNCLMSEALYQFLASSGYDKVVVSARPFKRRFIPDVLLVDITALRRDLLARYPETKILLVDSGLGPEKLRATLRSYRIHGILSPNADLDVLQKALKALTQGELWIDNGSVAKAMPDDAGGISQEGKIGHIASREQEIIEYICQGLTNKEIALRLGLSVHTVKAYLNRIFRKFNVTSRSKLMTLARRSRLTSG